MIYMSPGWTLPGKTPRDGVLEERTEAQRVG